MLATTRVDPCPPWQPLLLLLRLHKLALRWPNGGGVDETNSDSIFCGHFHCLISLPVTSCSFMSACAFKSKPVACNSAFHVRLISDIGVTCRHCFTRTWPHTQRCTGECMEPMPLSLKPVLTHSMHSLQLRTRLKNHHTCNSAQIETTCAHIDSCWCRHASVPSCPTTHYIYYSKLQTMSHSQAKHEFRSNDPMRYVQMKCQHDHWKGSKANLLE